MKGVYGIMIRAIPVLIVSFMLYQCCRHDEKDYYKLTDEDRQVVPYQDQQILKFRRDSTNEVLEVMVTSSEFSNDYDYTACGGECCDDWKNIEVRLIEFTSTTRQELFPVIVVNPYRKGSGKGEILFVRQPDFHKEDIAIRADADIPYDNEYVLECLPGYCEQSLDIGTAHFESVNKVHTYSYNNDGSVYETLFYYYTKDKGILKITREISEHRTNQVIVVSKEEYFAVL